MKVRRGALRRGAVAVFAAVLALVLTGCGAYYYRATIQGFVIEDETEAGINEATVRIYTSEVTSADAEGYVAQTSTVTQGGNAGYYASTVIWGRFFGGAYGQEGDTTTIWLGVEHPDFGSRVVSAQGILSDEDNLVASIRLSQTTFDLPALRGRVVDANGAGVNGVRIVLDFPQADDQTDDPEDQVTQSATIDGSPGAFEFSPVEWSDANTADAEGEVTAIIRVDDPEWGASDGTGPDDYIIEQSIVLVPGSQTRVAPDAFEVYRRPRTEFTATVTGRLIERINGVDGIEDRPVQGVRVELSYDRSGEPSPYRTLADHTDADGVYLFTVSWTDTVPGDYDDAGNIDLTADSSATTGISAGEDGLLVAITYDDVDLDGVDESPEDLEFSSGSLVDHRVYSNPRGGSNRLPDVIRTAP
ncbi:MAG: hypothetical protein ACOC1U_01815 [Spirochaetota bacterium]